MRMRHKCLSGGYITPLVHGCFSFLFFHKFSLLGMHLHSDYGPFYIPYLIPFVFWVAFDFGSLWVKMTKRCLTMLLYIFYKYHPALVCCANLLYMSTIRDYSCVILATHL